MSESITSEGVVRFCRDRVETVCDLSTSVVPSKLNGSDKRVIKNGFRSSTSKKL